MQLSKLFNDDKAVSPVIGVILMVAITVILAAVIGTFVLGLGDSLSDTTPSASINGDINNGQIVFTHQSGQNIDGANLRVADTGGNVAEDRGDIDGFGAGETFSAGDVIRLDDENQFERGDDETARLVFDSGSTSSTLASVDYDTNGE